MKSKVAVVAVGLGLMIGSVPLFAHHSFSAEYDTSKPVTMTGRFVKMDWTNPHSWVYFDYDNPTTGKTEQWRAETPPPNAMVRAGLRQNMLHAGDVITLSGNLAKDGTNLMWCGMVKFPNGAVVGLQAVPGNDSKEK